VKIYILIIDDNKEIVAGLSKLYNQKLTPKVGFSLYHHRDG
jgi:hypothetical protein